MPSDYYDIYHIATTDMLPISGTNNACLNCHMPDPCRVMNAVPLPKSYILQIWQPASASRVPWMVNAIFVGNLD